jgi:hypothetical protein
MEIIYMESQLFLKDAEFGKKGFDKQIVLAYIDELNSKIYSLENQFKDAQTAGGSDGGVDETVVRKLEDELKSLQKQIDSEKELRAQADKKVIEQSARIKELSERPVSNESDGEVIKKLEEKEHEVKQKSELLASKERKYSELEKKYSEKEIKINELNIQMLELNNQISELKKENQQLKDNADASPVASAFDMSSLFAEAQKTANRVTVEAQRQADEKIKAAEEKAEQITTGAQSKVDSLTKDAQLKADAILDEANKKSEKILTELDEKVKKENESARLEAKAELEEAERQKNEVKEITSAIKEALSNEVENVSRKINEVSDLILKLTNETNQSISSAKTIVDTAQKSINDHSKINELVAKLPTENLAASTAKKPDDRNAAVKKDNKEIHTSNLKPTPKKMDFALDLEALTKAVEEDAATGGGNFSDPMSGSGWNE